MKIREWLLVANGGEGGGNNTSYDFSFLYYLGVCVKLWTSFCHVRKEGIHILKIAIASIIAGVLFSLCTKLMMDTRWSKLFVKANENTHKPINFVLQGALFTVIMFIMFLIVKPFT
ncbi:hypothetical protein ABFY59_09485 [Priestia aryabhattai]|uniref:hypothetical protein n=1 Tax=Priestia aryabhattai TaxID=412384 RepID=UPI003D296CAF